MNLYQYNREYLAPIGLKYKFEISGYTTESIQRRTDINGLIIGIENV